MNRVSQSFVLVVVILMGLVVASNAIAGVPKSRIAKTRSDLHNIFSALQHYKLENGVYPSASQGLLALVEKPVGKPEALNWQEGGYLERVPKDPWGRFYLYRNPGVVDPVEVYSFGSDGKPGGCRDFYSSGHESEDSDSCEPREPRRSIFSWFLTAVVTICSGLILIYLIRRLYKSVDGNLQAFFTKLCVLLIWMVGFVIVLSLFTPKIV